MHVFFCFVFFGQKWKQRLIWNAIALFVSDRRAFNFQLIPTNIPLPTPGFFFYYSLLGNDVTNEAFFDLLNPTFPAERASVRLRSNVDVLRAFFSSQPGIEVNKNTLLTLCHAYYRTHSRGRGKVMCSQVSVRRGSWGGGKGSGTPSYLLFDQTEQGYPSLPFAPLPRLRSRRYASCGCTGGPSCITGSSVTKDTRL